MKRSRKTLLLVGLAAVLLGIGGYARYWHYHLHRFAEVHRGVLYCSGMPSERGLAHLARHCGVKTVVGVLPEDPELKDGLLFDWKWWPRERESAAAQRLGIRLVHWPVSGEQLYWPWLQPEQFDQFFALFDAPCRLPVAIHCVGGRHRTGTCVALFRLEYDRWGVEPALREMYSFDFGPPARLQEHNLRTYWPRPRPDAAQWRSLRAAFRPLLPGQPPAGYEELIRRLRQLGDTAERAAAVAQYLEASRPLGIRLASRLIDSPESRLLATALPRAVRCLASAHASFADQAVSAALIADYGSAAQQSKLLDLLARERGEEKPTPRYQALVAGVTNRYTRNRMAYLLPLLSDRRVRPEPAASKYRYCDTAVARLASIANVALFRPKQPTERAAWDMAVKNARRWFDEHPQTTQK